MSTSRSAKTLPAAAPVAMQHGRHGDRIALAQPQVDAPPSPDLLVSS